MQSYANTQKEKIKYVEYELILFYWEGGGPEEVQGGRLLDVEKVRPKELQNRVILSIIRTSGMDVH